MKKIILTITFLAAITINLTGQNENEAVFSSVPVVNGKVVFEQFVIADKNQSVDYNYSQLQQWAKAKYSASPLLSGIRFNDKSNSVTVSAGTNLKMPKSSNGAGKDMIMNYRFDASITNAGCILFIRDITFQEAKRDGDSFVPQKIAAEHTITDQAVKSLGNEQEFRNNLRIATLDFLNGLYSELNDLF